MLFPILTDWHKAILALAAVMLLCAATAVILRFARKKRAARIFFLFFIVFLFSAFSVLLVYANKVAENSNRQQLRQEIEKANDVK